MISKGSKMYSVLHGVCPRCQNGKIFKYAPYRLLNFTDMNDHCSYCGQSFEPEPDFYQGAMYVSYGLSTGLFLLIGVLLLFYLELGDLVAYAGIVVVGVVLWPVIFRVSRVIWLNLFVRYRPNRENGIN
jgi:hypothetical protein